MATADMGLFGPSPWEIQQAQQQQIDTKASNFARMSPFEKAGMMMYQGGAGLAGAVAPMFGGVNVAQQQAAQQQEAMQGVDTSTPEGLLKLAQRVKDFNPSRALQLVAEARKMREEDSQSKLREAQAKWYENRAPGLISYNSEIGPVTFNPADGTYQDGEGNPLSKDELSKLTLTRSTGAAGGKGNAKTTQLVPGADGFMHRVEKGIGGKSEIARDENGDPVTVAQFNVDLKTQLAQGGAGGKKMGEINADAQAQLPKVEQQVANVKYLGDQLFAHPGYQQLVGAGFPGLKALAGSNVPGAAALFGNIQGIAYLMAREELRGQGQVTEGEANMALAAFNRMNTTMNEKDFRAAYNDFVQRVENVRELLKTKGSLRFNIPQVSAPTTAAPMPQGVTPQTPVAPMPFSVTANSKNEVKAAYKAGKFGPVGSPEALNRANIILNQME